MPFRSLDLPWISQPPGRVGIDLTHPLASKVAFAYYGGNIASHISATTGAVRSAGPYGAAATVTATGVTAQQADVSRTVFILCRNTPASQIIRAGAGGVSGWAMSIPAGNQTPIWTDYGVADYTLPGLWTAANQWQAFAVRRDRGSANDLRLFNSTGTQVGSAVAGGSYNAGSYEYTLIGTPVSLLVVVEDALSQDAIREFLANPWQLFEPEPIQVYWPAAAGGGDITGSFAATEQADTLSSSGTILIQGSLSASEANDTLSAAGAILIQGALAAAEADDTLAAAGAVLIQGALSATESDETLSAAGVIGSLLTGSLAVTEADDVLSAAGTVLVQGQLGATESDDTLTGAAAVLLTGQLGATEQGDSLGAAAAVLVQGSLAATEGADTLEAAGVVGDLPTVSGALDVTEDDDTLFAAAVVPREDAGGGGPDRRDADDADVPAERFTEDASGWRKPQWVREREQVAKQDEAPVERRRTFTAEHVAPIQAMAAPAAIAAGPAAAIAEPVATEQAQAEPAAIAQDAVDLDRARIALKRRQQREIEEIMTVLMMAA